MTFCDAAEQVLRTHSPGAPMHYRDIAALAVHDGLLAAADGDRVARALNSGVYLEIRRLRLAGKPQRFNAAGRGFYSLAVPADPLGGVAERHNAEVRTRLAQALAEMDPAQFEVLIGQLLTAIGFEDVEVTTYHGDKGVDLRARLKVGGVTDVWTAIQAKRWAANVQAPAIRELRGGLGPHERGLVVTTSGFSAGAIEEAALADRSPISLLDGKRLVDLLVENEIGVTARSVMVLELDEAGLESVTDDDVSTETGTAKFKTLWPLPGGADQMKATLDSMMDYVVRVAPTLQEAVRWLVASQDGVGSEASARSYWRVPKSMGLSYFDGERLVLSSAGAEYLKVRSSEMLVDLLRANVVGIEEIIDAIAVAPRSNDDVSNLMNGLPGINWETDVQVKWRLKWLEVLGVIRFEDGRWVPDAV